MSWDRALDLLPHLVTLVAAFSGAWFAFRLNDRAKVSQTVRDQVAAVNRAQFALILQFQTLKTIQDQVVDPIREHPGRCVAMPALLELRDQVPRSDLDSLSFLFETDDRNLVLELMVENRHFDLAIQAINERSRLHLKEVQPRLDPAGIREGGTYSDSDFERALGEPLYLTLKRATEGAIDQIDQSILSCQSLSKRIYDAMKRRFPKQEIIRLEAASEADVSRIEIAPFVLRWSDWCAWERLERDARSDPLAVKLHDTPGVYEARLVNATARLTIGKASNLRMRIKQGLVKGKVPHSSGKRIRQGESTADVLVRWAETDWPSCAEEELHRRHIVDHGGLPKYTEQT